METVKARVAANDFMGARTKLIEMQYTFPPIHNISEMITVCDILSTASLEFLDCGIDWYWVLQLTPKAEDSEIYSQYLKLTSALKPIENSFPRTSSALKTIHEAFFVLSNPKERALFNLKRATRYETHGYLNSHEKHEVLEGSVTREDNEGMGSLEKVPLKMIKGRPNNFEVSNERKIVEWRPPELAYKTGPMNCFDFCNFEEIRKPGVFSVGQIWAAYDQENMPRRYAYVGSFHKSPFRICISWLRPVSDSVDEKRWIEVGLPVVCGSFGLDKNLKTVMTETKTFSHIISRLTRSTDQRVGIYPKKGESWAIYKDWEPEQWCSNPEARKGCSLQMVEVLTGYSDHADMVVVDLVKVAGFKNVFKRCTKHGNPCSFKIPAIHSYRFSHNLPVFRFLGGEMKGIYKDMLELDPSAVPNTPKPLDQRTSKGGPTLTNCHSVPPPKPPTPLEEMNTKRDPTYTHRGPVPPPLLPKPSKERNPNGGPTFTNRYSVPPPKSPTPLVQKNPKGDPTYTHRGPVPPPELPKPLTERNPKGSKGDPTFAHSCLVPPRKLSDTGPILLRSKWCASDFSPDQIWAIYNDPNSLPRQYVVVKSFFSGNEVSVSFLEPNPILDDEIHWVEDNLPFVCGLFRAPQSVLNLSMSQFSHLVDCESSRKKSFYKIYPKKGEIWAMYTDWNSKWKLSDFDKCRYQIVEVISDFSDDNVIKTASLVEVSRYKTMFRKQFRNGFELKRAISKTEILSFSHQIPAFRVPGIEVHGVPEESWHLEPDALPRKFGTPK